MVMDAITSAHAKGNLLHRTQKRRVALLQRRFLYGTGMMQEGAKP
jgi:hypothetical protein